ncbi:hypothetical protein ACB092_09G216200 [Castanea dentata]
MDTETHKELERRQKEETELKAIMAEKDMRLNNLQSSAFKLANYYFVFQGVILTIVCNGSETSLKKSDRWFLFTVSIIVVVLNSAALIKTGIKYIKTQADQEVLKLHLNAVFASIGTLERKIKSPESIRKIYIPPEDEKRARKETERNGYNYLAICMIFFLGFAAVVFVGCWKFLGTQNEVGFNLPSNDKCIRLCNSAKCLNICSEHRYSSKIQASSMYD